MQLFGRDDRVGPDEPAHRHRGDPKTDDQALGCGCARHHHIGRGAHGALGPVRLQEPSQRCEVTVGKLKAAVGHAAAGLLLGRSAAFIGKGHGIREGGVHAVGDAPGKPHGRAQRGQVVRMGEAFGDRDDVAVDRGPAPEQAYSGQPS